MQTIFTVVHVLLAVALIGLVLIQHGKGADAGAAFGSGASATVFGAQGSGSFLTRSTAIIATLFFLTSMGLAYFSAQSVEPSGLMDGVEVPAAPAVPVDPMVRTATVPEDVPQPAPMAPAAAVGSDVPSAPAIETPVVRVDAGPAAPADDVPVVQPPAAASGAAEPTGAGTDDVAGDKPSAN